MTNRQPRRRGFRPTAVQLLLVPIVVVTLAVIGVRIASAEGDGEPLAPGVPAVQPTATS